MSSFVSEGSDHVEPNAPITYVLDTSVLLSDPRAMLRFAEHEVIIPFAVITELEAKRHHLELGYFARKALRLLDDLRQRHGRLDLPVRINPQGGMLHVELDHGNQSVLPRQLRSSDNDTRILAVALDYLQERSRVVLVTKDVPLRIKAAALGVSCQEYRAEQEVDSGWTGMVTVDVSDEVINKVYHQQSVSVPFPPSSDGIGQPAHAGLILKGPNGSALARRNAHGKVSLVHSDIEAFGLHGRSAEQRVALDFLLDSSVGIVSLGGRAGTGKSALALCAGLEAVMERREHSKVMVFRPLYAVGGQELGFLPGTEGEKMSPWAQAVYDTLGSIVAAPVREEIMNRDLVEVLPLTHIRGRSLHDAFVIVDEAQSLERNVLLTVLSRIGQNSRVVLTHDVAQRDNLHVGRYDGIAAVVEQLKGSDLFAHVTLTRSERSAIAELVTEVLNGEDA